MYFESRKLMMIMAFIFLPPATTVANGHNSEGPFPQTTFRDFLADLPVTNYPISFENFDSRVSLKAAARLQQLPKAQRERWLLSLARVGRKSVWALVLCRMLYVSSASHPLRDPRIGSPSIIKPLLNRELPQYPILLHEGVPFWIVKGLSFAGWPESPLYYVRYTIANGSERKERFHLKTSDECKSAAESLITSLSTSPSWLSMEDARFLRDQVK